MLRKYFRKTKASFLKWRRRNFPRTSLAVDFRRLVRSRGLQGKVDVRHDLGPGIGNVFTLVRISESPESRRFPWEFERAVEDIIRKWYPRARFRIADRSWTLAEVKGWNPFIDTGFD